MSARTVPRIRRVRHSHWSAPAPRTRLQQPQVRLGVLPSLLRGAFQGAGAHDKSGYSFAHADCAKAGVKR